jgi:CubicO group peptidase (beta-lactamase class C family)
MEETLHFLVEKEAANIRQAVALKDGKVVYSDCWEGFKADDCLHLMSVTKSIVSILVGIAIDQGLIEGPGQKVLDFFPEYQVLRGEHTIQRVCIKDLLTMTAPYKYRSEPWTKVCTSDDWTAAALDLLGGKAGLEGTFRYSTLGIHILTGIIARTTGKSTAQWANENLFSPLGIEPCTGYEALTAEEHKAFILSRTPKKHIWFSDPKGVGTAGYGLCLNAMDMARLGQMCLEGGIYDGRRIVSSSWIREMTSQHASAGPMFQNMGYGYLWWIIDPGKGIYAAIGNSGNVIYVNPMKNVVIAVTAAFKPTVMDRIQFIQRCIEPRL